MFNTFAYAPRTVEHHTHVEMVDPSIQKGAEFLNEVQAEAEKRVKDAILVNVKALSVELLEYRYAKSPMDFTMRHLVAFKMNGRTVTLTIEQEEYDRDGDNTLMKAFADAVSREITSQILIKGDNPFTKTKYGG